MGTDMNKIATEIRMARIAPPPLTILMLVWLEKVDAGLADWLCHKRVSVAIFEL
jgi:hypothetical protein